MTVKELENPIYQNQILETMHPWILIPLILPTWKQKLIYRILQNLYSRILKRSYKNSTIFICRRLEELELSWSDVRYLFRVLRLADETFMHHLKDTSLYVKNPITSFQNLPLMHMNYCLVNSGAVIYPSSK